MSRTLDLNTILTTPLPFHRDAQGDAISYGMSKDLLRYLASQISADDLTLETGAGVSTVVLTFLGARHTCVVPDQGLTERIREHCQKVGINSDSLSFMVERSEDALPKIQGDGYACVIVDGRHAFPSPFIDWYYGCRLLKPGGLLVVDDIQLWTGDVLRRFLLAEPGWTRVYEVRGRSSVFRMDAEGTHDRWWYEQPFLLQQNPAVRRRLKLEKWWAKLRGKN